MNTNITDTVITNHSPFPVHYTPSHRGEGRDGVCLSHKVTEGYSSPSLRWHVLHCSSSNALELCELIQSKGVRAFTPTEYRPMTIGKEKVWQQEPSRPDLLFVQGTYDTIHSLLRQHGLTSVNFISSQTSEGITAPITVPDDSMSNLIRLVQVGLPQSYSVTDKEIHYRPGGPVRIIDGPFKGVVGRVARIHTQTRVVVTIPGIISFATTYIPKHQMEAV